MNRRRPALGSFEPRLEILARAQRRLWDELDSHPPYFVLYGGTALALRLGHRRSDDFDFFSNRPFVPQQLLDEVPYLRNALVRQQEPNTLTCRIERSGRVLISFFGGLRLNRAADPEIAKGTPVRVASLLDLAATKVAVIAGRASLKDYVDIDALLRAGIELPNALAAARAIYGPRFNPLPSLKALTFFEEGDVRKLPADKRRRLRDAASSVDRARLPMLKARRGLL